MIFVLLGKSGSGKDTSFNYIINNFKIKPLISTTTRPKRITEINKKDYYFITKNKFLEMKLNNRFIETRSYNISENETWYYGLCFSEIPNSGNSIVILENNGLSKLKEKYKNIKTIYLWSDNREERAIKRGSFNKTEWDRRFIEDNKDFNNKEYDFIIENKNIIDTEVKISKILSSFCI